MATDTASGPYPSAAEERKQLLEKLARFGDRPFQHEIVQSPWQPVVDVEGLHGPVKEAILKIVTSCGQPEVARCLTVTGPSGYGKTHLLGWARQRMDEQDLGIFVYIPPYQVDSGAVETFVVRAVIDSLRFSSPRQSALFRLQAREFLVHVY